MSVATQDILFADDDDIDPNSKGGGGGVDKGGTLSPSQAKKIKKSVSQSGLLPAPRSKGDKPKKSKKKNLKKHHSALSFDTNIFAEGRYLGKICKKILRAQFRIALNVIHR